MATKETAGRYLRIIQINVGRSLTAMSKLREYCTRHKVDIACIQEPAIRYGKLVSLPAANTREYYIFHSKDSMAAIIILNRNLVVTKMNQGTETHLLTIELLLNRKNFYINNQYCQFSEPVEDHTSKLSNMHILAKKHNIVYCADINAKSSLWFSSITDHKREIVQETLWNLEFQIANEPGQPPTYQG